MPGEFWCFVFGMAFLFLGCGGISMGLANLHTYDCVGISINAITLAPIGLLNNILLMCLAGAEPNTKKYHTVTHHPYYTINSVIVTVTSIGYIVWSSFILNMGGECRERIWGNHKSVLVIIYIELVITSLAAVTFGYYTYVVFGTFTSSLTTNWMKNYREYRVDKATLISVQAIAYARGCVTTFNETAECDRVSDTAARAIRYVYDVQRTLYVTQISNCNAQIAWLLSSIDRAEKFLTMARALRNKEIARGYHDNYSVKEYLEKIVEKKATMTLHRQNIANARASLDEVTEQVQTQLSKSDIRDMHNLELISKFREEFV